MKYFFIETIKQVLKVFNYKLYNFKDEIEVEETWVKKPENEDKNGVLKLLNNNFDDYKVLQFSVALKHDAGHKLYKSEIKLGRKIINLRELQRVWHASAKALKVFCISYNDSNVNKTTLAHLVEKAIEDSIIAQLINSKFYDRRVDVISKVLAALSKWANRTYEGRKVPFSFLFNIGNIDENKVAELVSFLGDDACALLTDGITSYLSIGDGLEYCIAPFYDIEKKGSNKVPLVPYRFSSFGSVCSGKNVGIVLTVQGDILFIKDQKLFYTKRNGNWYYYNYDAFADTLFKGMDDMYAAGKKDAVTAKTAAIKCIYLACLDVAFARTGGCLAVCPQENIKKVKKDIPKEDIHGSQIKKGIKRGFLEDTIIHKRSFYDIERKSRQELLGIDGATVIKPDGEIITTGAIIDNTLPKDCPMDEVNHGGARTKIAQKLSLYGIAIKISADGYIECYKNLKNIF